jgi:hypothetical protein
MALLVRGVHREFVHSSGRRWSRRPPLATTCRAFPTTARHDREESATKRLAGFVSVPLSANASVPSCTAASGSACLPHAGSGHADTVNHYHAHTTAHTGLRDDPIRLMKRRGCHCLRRCRNGQRKASGSYQSDHSFPPFVDVSLPANSVSFGKRKLTWRSQPPAPST